MDDQPTRSTWLRRTVAFALPAAAVLTVACGLAYLLVQQDLRLGANDPQIQLAEDAAAALDAGVAPSTVVSTGPTVDLATSLAPWITVDDATGTVLATDGQLDGRPPTPPSGVLTTARERGTDRVTWEPRSGVRIALVAVPWSGGTVLAGRSLREIEAREETVLQLAMFAGLVGLVIVVTASAVAAWLWPEG